jgi:hypothetical protein
MVEVRHKSHYSGSKLLLAHQAQQVYYLSYPHPSFKNWWVVYKVHPKMHTHRYDEYVEGHEDDDIYQFFQVAALSPGSTCSELGGQDDDLSSW